MALRDTSISKGLVIMLPAVAARVVRIKLRS